jgi:hypothetical protein
MFTAAIVLLAMSPMPERDPPDDAVDVAQPCQADHQSAEPDPACREEPDAPAPQQEDTPIAPDAEAVTADTPDAAAAAAAAAALAPDAATDDPKTTPPPKRR